MSGLVTYQVEPFEAAWNEILPLLPLHWAEVGTNRDKIPLDPDVAEYRRLAIEGALHILTARRAGQLMGYHVSIVRPHLHYRSTLMAFTDVYWLHPECRRGMAGVRMFREAERTLKQRGVKKMFTGTKLSLDMSAIFARLGWFEAERLHSKWIGG